jgi:hypothetical protein
MTPIHGSCGRRLGAGLVALALGGCSTAPSPPPGWTGPFEVEPVLARACTAVGGPGAIELPATVHSRSRIVLYPQSGAPIDATLEFFAQAPDLDRRELVTSDGHVLIQVEAHGRSLEMEDGHPTGADRSLDAARRRRYRRLLAELAEPGPKPARLVADPGADPRAVVVVERELAPGERWQAWLDATSFLVVRIRCLTRGSDGDHVDEDFLSSHERYGERVIPRRQVTWRDGRRMKEAWLQEFEEGVTLDPQLFVVDVPR